MRKISVRKLVFASLSIALGILMPFLTAQLPGMGSRFLPMHIPVLLSGFICGWDYGMLVGFTVPMIRSMLFGMPPIFPVAAAMAIELAVYGGMTGFLYRLLPKKTVYLYIALITSMICGRIALGATSILLYGLSGTQYTFEIFIAGTFFNAIPGVVIQLIVVPILIIALERSGVIINE